MCDTLSNAKTVQHALSAMENACKFQQCINLENRSTIRTAVLPAHKKVHLWTFRGLGLSRSLPTLPSLDGFAALVDDGASLLVPVGYPATMSITFLQSDRLDCYRNSKLAQSISSPIISR